MTVTNIQAHTTTRDLDLAILERHNKAIKENAEFSMNIPGDLNEPIV
jgi:hypothetical protein